MSVLREIAAVNRLHAQILESEEYAMSLFSQASSLGRNQVTVTVYRYKA